jgi:hypothetical protein
MEIERTGAGQMPPMGAYAAGNPAPSAARPASGLEVAYRRSDVEANAADAAPTSLLRVAAYAVPAVPFLGAIAALDKVAHRQGGRSFLALAPRAFDASSSVQSGGFALATLAAAIAVGFVGVKLQPRSHGMLGAAALLLVASLAMVTVTLVSLDEHPLHPDGALLIPYAMPFAILFIGLGLAWRGIPSFLAGGKARAMSPIYGALGGVLTFAGIELSFLAKLLP